MTISFARHQFPLRSSGTLFGSILASHSAIAMLKICSRSAVWMSPTRRRGKGRNRIVGSRRARPAQEQSGREFASADTTTRAQDAALQIAGISPAPLVDSRCGPKHRQRPTPSHIPPHAPRPPRRSVPDVANRYCCVSSNLGIHSSCRQPSSRDSPPRN